MYAGPKPVGTRDSGFGGSRADLTFYSTCNTLLRTRPLLVLSDVHQFRHPPIASTVLLHVSGSQTLPGRALRYVVRGVRLRSSTRRGELLQFDHDAARWAIFFIIFGRPFDVLFPSTILDVDSPVDLVATGAAESPKNYRVAQTIVHLLWRQKQKLKRHRPTNRSYR